MALGNKLNCGLYIGFCVIKHEKSTSQHDSHVISFDKSWCLKVMSWSIPEKSTNVQNSIRIEQLHCVLNINLIANVFLNSFVLITEVVQDWILIHEIYTDHHKRPKRQLRNRTFFVVEFVLYLKNGTDICRMRTNI